MFTFPPYFSNDFSTQVIKQVLCIEDQKQIVKKLCYINITTRAKVLGSKNYTLHK